ncbi:FkbM family methyltransferase [Aurantimonas sp. 22II-16-19i]|uniref:FkbM family methyltransferase n=1 Tax=Aurantimonas sp. 22II-16-19i TaxID=1317114 RepID=UPI0009F7E010|nr:FkbM family methyltransferase [Aurantimonas sp. 22II-16-19i]ORE89945.1 methyltransferase [Aurantimonas sp. 22II-16-19i]
MDAVLAHGATARTLPAMPVAQDAFALLCEANGHAPAGGPVRLDGRPLWLYGAGNLGRLARAHLGVVGQEISGVVDGNAAAHRDSDAWAGLDVRDPADVPAKTKADALLAVSVVTTPFVPLRAALLAAGWGQVVPFYDVAEGFRDRHPLSNGWFAERMDEAALGRASEVLAGLADDASRAHYLRFAVWRLCRQEWDFPTAPVTTGDRFFIPGTLAAFRPGERVLDAGAHRGELVPAFHAALGERLAKLWAVEPDPASLTALHAARETWPAALSERVTIIDAVLAEKSGRCRFHAGLGYASQIAASGQCERDATTIDALGLEPTVIKLHLEGGELAALKGAMTSVRRHRPILMLTVYHDAAGLLETPLYLMRNLDGYAVLMRTHSHCGTGAVLYAIPKERMR